MHLTVWYGCGNCVFIIRRSLFQNLVRKLDILLEIDHLIPLGKYIMSFYRPFRMT